MTRARPMTWEEVAALDPIWLNLGGKSHCEPHPEYRGYVSVDVEPGEGWHVLHDLREPIPLPDASVDRVHTEDFLHYLTRPDMEKMLAECHRLLKPGGRLRVSLPDYGNPKDRSYFEAGSDSRHPRHLVLTDYVLMADILSCTPFSEVEFYHFWEGGAFVERPFDEKLGTIQRVPGKDPRTRTDGVDWRWKLRNAAFHASRGWRVAPAERPFLRGDRLHVTSLVVDCFKA